MPRPTRPMDEAGPLKGNMPPTLISVGVTPGLSTANADDPSAIANAHAIFNAMNIAFSSDLPASAATGRGASFLLGGGGNESSQPKKRGCISPPSIVDSNLQFFF